MNQYREGKVKRTLNKGVKENLKPYAYKQSEVSYETDGVPIEECAGDLMYVARLSEYGAIAKASLNRAFSLMH